MSGYVQVLFPVIEAHDFVRVDHDEWDEAVYVGTVVPRRDEMTGERILECQHNRAMIFRPSDPVTYWRWDA